jgi:transcriptional regulator CtsR
MTDQEKMELFELIRQDIESCFSENFYTDYVEWTITKNLLTNIENKIKERLQI